MAKFIGQEAEVFKQLVNSRKSIQRRINEIETLQYKLQSESMSLLKENKQIEDKISGMSKKLSVKINDDIV